jgi:hypothetical protein
MAYIETKDLIAVIDEARGRLAELERANATLKAREAYLEECVRVRDEPRRHEGMITDSMRCRHCGSQTNERCKLHCPTVTHPLEGKDVG